MTVIRNKFSYILVNKLWSVDINYTPMLLLVSFLSYKLDKNNTWRLRYKCYTHQQCNGFWQSVRRPTGQLSTESCCWISCYFASGMLYISLTYKALNDHAPSYLQELIVTYYPTRTLQSQNAGRLMVSRVSKGTWRQIL